MTHTKTFRYIESNYSINRTAMCKSIIILTMIHKFVCNVDSHPNFKIFQAFLVSTALIDYRVSLSITIAFLDFITYLLNNYKVKALLCLILN